MGAKNPLIFMDAVEEVRSFAREFVNGHRTPAMKIKIKEAYKQITGEKFTKTCILCLIEAIYKIINFKKMEKSRYQLKKGALLSAFGDESKTITNANITDELAEWHLKNTRGAASLFAVMPYPIEQETTAEIVKPKVITKRSPRKTKR